MKEAQSSRSKDKVLAEEQSLEKEAREMLGIQAEKNFQAMAKKRERNFLVLATLNVQAEKYSQT